MNTTEFLSNKTDAELSAIAETMGLYRPGSTALPPKREVIIALIASKLEPVLARATPGEPVPSTAAPAPTPVPLPEATTKAIAELTALAETVTTNFRKALEDSATKAIADLTKGVEAVVTPAAANLVAKTTALVAREEIIRARLAEQAMDSAKKVHIFAGGREFVTTVGTLSYGDTFFARVLASTSAIHRDDGRLEISVDINPDYFQIFLDYMRSEGWFPTEADIKSAGLSVDLMRRLQARYCVNVSTVAGTMVPAATSSISAPVGGWRFPPPTGPSYRELKQRGLIFHFRIQGKTINFGKSDSTGDFDATLLAKLTSSKLSRNCCVIRKNRLQLALPAKCTIVAYRLTYGGRSLSDSGSSYSHPDGWTLKGTQRDGSQVILHRQSGDPFEKEMTRVFVCDRPVSGIVNLHFDDCSDVRGTDRFAVKCLELYGQVDE